MNTFSIHDLPLLACCSFFPYPHLVYCSPFFEDIEAANPTVYVIHNLLTVSECNILVRQAGPLVQPLLRNDPLQLTTQYDKFIDTDRVYLWQGMLQGPELKAVQDRIEQVTGFPSNHFSDWIVNRLHKGSYWQPQYNTLAGNFVPMATITVFLSAVDDYNTSGGDLVYPSCQSEIPIRIRPVQGMAVVHHNSDEKNQFDANSVHAILPVQMEGDFYVATKYILPLPVSYARRVILPVLVLTMGGRLPNLVVWVHDILIEQFGVEDGGNYFDKVCVVIPILMALVIAQFVGRSVHYHMTKETSTRKTTTTTANTKVVEGGSTTTTRRNKKKD